MSDYKVYKVTVTVPVTSEFYIRETDENWIYQFISDNESFLSKEVMKDGSPDCENLKVKNVSEVKEWEREVHYLIYDGEEYEDIDEEDYEY